MAKRHKVKRYYGEGGTVFRAKPRLITVVLAVLLLAGLGYLGTVIYQPAYELIMSIGGKLTESEQDPAPESASVPEPSSEESESEPEPEPQEQAPFKAVYAPFDIVSNSNRFDSFLSSLGASEINTVMIDVKNDEGAVLFNSENENAVKWGLISPQAVDLAALAKKLEENGLMLAVRMSLFKDPSAASAGRLDYAINYQDSNYLWLDNSPENGGRPWLNPYAATVREYLESIMLEAIDAGAALVVLENARFPDNSAVYASFGEQAQGISRTEILKTVIAGLEEAAEERNARVVVYFPVTEATNASYLQNRYGGDMLGILSGYIMPDVRPIVFGDGYSSEGLEVTAPATNPGAAVTAAFEYLKDRLPEDTMLIPMLEGGGKETTASQIAAVTQLGGEEYVLYNEAGEYGF